MSVFHHKPKAPVAPQAPSAESMRMITDSQAAKITAGRLVAAGRMQRQELAYLLDREHFGEDLESAYLPLITRKLLGGSKHDL